MKVTLTQVWLPLADQVATWDQACGLLMTDYIFFGPDGLARATKWQEA